MGCKAKHIAATAPRPAAGIITLGEQGITLIEYIGWFDIEEYTGPVTGVVYRFGLDRPRGYVDNRDLDWFLSVTEDGQKVFQLWQS